MTVNVRFRRVPARPTSRRSPCCASAPSPSARTSTLGVRRRRRPPSGGRVGNRGRRPARGRHRPGVQAVQQKLIGFGYYVAGGADGHFGAGHHRRAARVPAAERSQPDRRRHREHGALSRAGRRGAGRGAPPPAALAADPSPRTDVGRRSAPRHDRRSRFASCNSPFSPRACTSVAARTARSDHRLTEG